MLVQQSNKNKWKETSSISKWDIFLSGIDLYMFTFDSYFKLLSFVNHIQYKLIISSII